MLYGLRNTNKFSKQNTFIKCMRGKSKSRLKKSSEKNQNDLIFKEYSCSSFGNTVA
jgi:hypothetical protein